jgi:hypothetical protein
VWIFGGYECTCSCEIHPGSGNEADVDGVVIGNPDGFISSRDVAYYVGIATHDVH